jgi:hypothetical protein
MIEGSISGKGGLAASGPTSAKVGNTTTSEAIAAQIRCNVPCTRIVAPSS